MLEKNDDYNFIWESVCKMGAKSEGGVYWMNG
jgi:hypothetical protein